MGNINNFDSKVLHSKNVDKAEILSVPNFNHESTHVSESFKCLLEESLDSALPHSSLFSNSFR